MIPYVTAKPNIDISNIEIPVELLPRDGRFCSGPSKVRDEQVEHLAKVSHNYLGTSHRQATVKSVVAKVREGLRGLFSLPEDYEVVLGNGGTTCFWDAATFALIKNKSQHTIFGEFSSKFATCAKSAPHLEDPEIIEGPPGTCSRPRASGEIDLYALTHCETSTGVATEVRRPEGAVMPERGGGIVAVDATSAAGGLRVDAHEFDVYYFAPQKCFASEGGLWISLLSPAATGRIEEIAASSRSIPQFFNLKTALDNSRLDQTYNTPSLATLYLLADQIDWINSNGGLEWSAGRCDRSAEILYTWAENSGFATPFVADPLLRSHVVATVDFADSIDAKLVAAVLRSNGILDTEPYRKLGRNQLRIAMFPAIDPEDVAAVCACINYVVAALSG